MGREIKRVPLDFDWPRGKIWQGYLSPERFEENVCPGCVKPPTWEGQHPRGDGYSRHGQHLHGLWYGYAPFRPEDNGSTPLTPGTPAVRAFAERNVASSPGYYGAGEDAVHREASRLCQLWNGMWSHHLNRDDVAALVDGERLRDFTHTFDPNRDPRWQAIDPPVIPTAEQVNEWSLRGMGHDAINASVVIRARCEREGQRYTCSTCDGRGSLEAYPGQRAEAEAWEPTEPPAGDGWQLWETVSEGSPISPVFADAEGLAQWLTTPDSCWGATRRPMTIEQARGFVGVGWAPSGFITAGGVHDGAEYVGTVEALRGHEGEASR